jgi:hypothetical protein
MTRLLVLMWCLIPYVPTTAQTAPPPATPTATPLPARTAQQPGSFSQQLGPEPTLPPKPWHHHPLLPSLVTLLGAGLTAIIAYKVFKGTLAFNREKHKEDTANALRKHAEDTESGLKKHRADRELAIRKDIFFSLHAVSTEAMYYVLTILNRDLKLESVHDSMRALAIEITKFQAASGKEAMDAAFTLQEAIAVAYSELVPSRKHIDELVTRRDNIVQEFEELRANIDVAREDLAKPQADLENAVNSVRQAVAKHYIEMQQWMQRIQQPQLDFIMLTRRELGLELDEAWFQKRRNEILERALARLQATGI